MERIDLLPAIEDTTWAELPGVLICNCHHPVAVQACLNVGFGSRGGEGFVEDIPGLGISGLAYAMLHSQHSGGLVLSFRDRYFRIRPIGDRRFAWIEEVELEPIVFSKKLRKVPLDPSLRVCKGRSRKQASVGADDAAGLARWTSQGSHGNS